MRNITICLSAAALTAISSPAVAQYSNSYAQYNPTSAQNYGSPYTSGNMTWRIAQLQTRLDDGLRSRSISRREAYPIRLEIQRLQRLERQFTVNGLTGQERAALQQRIRAVRQQLRAADDGGLGRYAEWDREDGIGRSSSSPLRVDANNDGWDDRDLNRNGAWNDDVNYGYQEPALGTAVGGLINGVLGLAGMQIGQRVPSNLYAVPYQHQAHYRDGNGVSYRSDGRQIYQIDARTHTVARVFPI